MHLFYTIVTSIFLSWTTFSDVPYAKIEKAFEANNATEIVGVGKEKILINVLGKESAYSQSQAALVLKDFFTKHPGSAFEFVFKGKESADGTFAIGNYTSQNQKFRTTIHFKKIGSVFKIESLAIERS